MLFVVYFLAWSLGVVYTMDNEVVPRPCKNVWLVVELVWGPFQFTPRKNVRVTMDCGVHKIHIWRPTLSTYMVWQVLWWERQKRCFDTKRQKPMAHKCCYSKNIQWNLFREETMKTRWRQRNDQTWFNYISKCLFCAYCIFKIKTFIFLVHGHSSRFTFGLHLVRGQNIL